MRDWLRAALWAAVLLPLGIVLHEVAHFAGYVAFGLPEPKLAYASSGFAGMREYWIMLREGERAAAEAIAPIRDVGLAALFGPLMTILIGAAGLLLVAIRGSIFGGAVAFTFFFRAVPIAFAYTIGSPEHTDEAHIAITLGIPDLVPVFIQVAGLLAAGWLLLLKSDWKVTLAILAATIASLVFWMTALGPLVLPE